MTDNKHRTQPHPAPPFHFYPNTFAISLSSVSNAEGKFVQDLRLSGNPEIISQALIEMMEKHEQVRNLIIITATKYLGEK